MEGKPLLPVAGVIACVAEAVTSRSMATGYGQEAVVDGMEAVAYGWQTVASRAKAVICG